MSQPELKPAYARCPLCLQYSVWFTADGELPRQEPIACKWCGAALDREQHKSRPLDAPKWAQ